MDLLTHLETENVITPSVRQSLGPVADSGNADIEQALLAAGIDAAALRTGIASYYGIPEHVLQEDDKVGPDVLEYIPYESAEHYHIIPLRMDDGVLVVGVNDPDDLRIREALSFVSSKYNVPYRFAFLLNKDIDTLLESYENLTGEVDQALTSLETETELKIADQKQDLSKESSESLAREHIKEDAPVTKIVATILRYAIDGKASDIHIEPTTKNLGVRFRVDGILQKSLELPRNVQSAVVARVKILSSLRLDEKRKPQDGRFSATFDDRKIDFRVSILPTNHGEKIVMRILDNERGISSLEDTGISDYNLDTIRRIMKEPYGIILISGPTGSGKSTTLYTMLNAMDRTTKNVLSLEDPIEYNIDGVAQSQVRPEIDYTFANGLRSALRQDPDIIMVGEIRDTETAQLAIQAALTGHLVLSTLHTNNSIGVVARLVDMGIDPYLIAPTLKLAIAQRLSRRICPDTGREELVDESFMQMFDKEFTSLPEQYRSRIPKPHSIVHPEPSPGCASGMKGRVAVMETLEITDDIRSLILNNGSEADIYKVARKNGFMSMKEDAIIKALEKVIPYQEVSMFGTKVGDESAISAEFLPSDTPTETSDAPSNSFDVKQEPATQPQQQNKDTATAAATSPKTEEPEESAAPQKRVDNPPASTPDAL